MQNLFVRICLLIGVALRDVFCAPTLHTGDNFPEYTKEIFYRNFYMRDNDRFEIDFSNLVNMYSTSVNFSSNNPEVELPGLIRNDDSTVHMSNKIFTPKVVRSAENHTFVLNKWKGPGSLTVLEYDNKSGFKRRMEADLKKMLAGFGDTMTCGDILLNHHQIILLCWDNVELSKKVIGQKYHYYIFGYDYFRNHSIMRNVVVEGQWMDAPRIRVFNNSNKNIVDGKIDMFLIYDRQINPNVQLDYRNEVILLPTQVSVSKRKTKYELKPLPSRCIPISEILYANEPVSIKVVNVMTMGNEDNTVVFNVRQMTDDRNIEQRVYTVDVHNISGDAKDIRFSQPKDMMENVGIVQEQDNPDTNETARLLMFAISEEFYIVLDTAHRMYFCVHRIKYCKKGKFSPDWNINKVLVVGSKGIVLMTVKGVGIILVNDFETNSIYYIYDDNAGVQATEVVRVKNANFENEYYCMKFYAYGFKMTNISLSYKFAVKAAAIKNRPRTIVALDGRQVMKLELSPWDGSQIVVDKYLANPIIIRNSKDRFMIRLPFRGSNMQFHEPHRDIRYFNKIEFNFNVINIKTRGPYFLFGKGTYAYVFFNNSVIIFECSVSIKHFRSNCIQMAEVNFAKSIRIEDIRKAKEQGDFILLYGQRANTMRVFDIHKNELVEYTAPESFLTEATDCDVSRLFITCAISLVDKVEHTVMVYAFEKYSSIVELPVLNAELRAKISSIRLSDKFGKTDGILINRISSDFISPKNIFILMNVLIEQTYETVLLNVHVAGSKPIDYRIDTAHRMYDIEADPRITAKAFMITLNSQVVIINDNPKFSMFCYDGASYYEFEYIDVQRIIAVELLLSQNIVALLYENHDDKEVYYALYKITQNAVGQLIRNELIPNFKEKSFRMGFVELSSTIVALVMYNIETNKILNSYLYFEEGPILVGDDLETPLTIDGKQYKMESREDSSYVSNNLTIVNKGNIAITKDTNTIDIESIVGLTGHVRDINFLSENKYKRRMEMIKPLMPVQIDGQASKSIFKYEENGKGKGHRKRSYTAGYFEAFDDTIIYQTKPHQYTVANIAALDKARSVTFVLEEGASCNTLALHDDFIACVYTVGPFHKIAVINMTGEGVQEAFTVPVGGKNYKFVIVEQKRFVISGIGESDKSTMLFILDRVTRESSMRIIANQLLFTDILKVYDYHVTYHPEEKLITMIIFDGYYNTLRMIQINDHFHVRQYVKRDMNLYHYHTRFLNMTCTHEYVKTQEDSSAYVWNFNLIADSMIFAVEVLRVKTVETATYNFVMNKLDHYYNVLYDSTLNPVFTLYDTNTENYMFMYDGYKAKSDKTGFKIAMYVKGQGHGHGYYMLTLPDGERVLNIYANQTTNLLSYFYEKDGEVSMKNLQIGKYQLKIIKQAILVQSTKADFDVDFQFGKKKKFTIKFYDALKTQLDDYRNRAVEQLLLLVCIVVVTLLIFVCLVALVVLFNGRKKEIARMVEEVQNQASEIQNENSIN